MSDTALRPGRVERPAGPAGNEHFTALLGTVLFVLLAVEGVTIVALGMLVVPHIVLGFALIGPLLFKMGSTVYRFFRYYTGSQPYRQAGPPAPFPRVIGPLVLILSAAVIATGVALVLVPAGDRASMYSWHKATFIAWFIVMTGHVLWYIWRIPRIVGADVAPRATSDVVPGRGLRLTGVATALVLGLVIAGLTAHLATPWQGGPFLN
jgi:hypothetical protein